MFVLAHEKGSEGVKAEFHDIQRIHGVEDLI